MLFYFQPHLALPHLLLQEFLFCDLFCRRGIWGGLSCRSGQDSLGSRAELLLQPGAALVQGVRSVTPFVPSVPQMSGTSSPAPVPSAAPPGASPSDFVPFSAPAHLPFVGHGPGMRGCAASQAGRGAVHGVFFQQKKKKCLFSF